MSKITVKDIDRWFSIIHNDLYQIHCDLQKPATQKMRKEIYLLIKMIMKLLLL